MRKNDLILTALLCMATAGGAPAQMVKPGTAPNQLSARQALHLLKAERDQFFVTASREIYRQRADLMTQHQGELGRGLYFAKLIQGDPLKKQIALTFDDGPHPGYTAQILQILKRYDARATFFVVGAQAEKHPDLIRAEIAGGHEVGNHTFDHFSLVKIPPSYVPIEIKACGEALKRITGRAPHLFRPPGGEYNRAVAQAAGELGYTMVLWTGDPGDYASPGASVILRRTLHEIGPGGILLLHDGIAQTMQVLPQILQYLRDNGYEMVTVDEMMAQARHSRSLAGR